MTSNADILMPFIKCLICFIAKNSKYWNPEHDNDNVHNEYASNSYVNWSLMLN